MADLRVEATRPAPGVGRGTLVALLASPPTTSGARTERKVRQALHVLGADRYIIANLYAFPVKDLPALSGCGAEPAGWVSARTELKSAVLEADVLLAAWGLHQLRGAGRRLQHDQFAWLRDLLSETGHRTAWCVGGEARHPSRWHQYVSDKHGRTTRSCSFEERLDQVLVEVPLPLLLGPPSRLGKSGSLLKNLGRVLESSGINEVTDPACQGRPRLAPSHDGGTQHGNALPSWVGLRPINVMQRLEC